MGLVKRGVVATAFILPGLDVITFEHRFDPAFLHPLCLDSPWVPSGHEDRGRVDCATG
jgi:hypothetical protein